MLADGQCLCSPIPNFCGPVNVMSIQYLDYELYLSSFVIRKIPLSGSLCDQRENIFVHIFLTKSRVLRMKSLHAPLAA